MTTKVATAPFVSFRSLRAALAALILAVPPAIGAEWQPQGFVPAPPLTGWEAVAHLKE